MKTLVALFDELRRTDRAVRSVLDEEDVRAERLSLVAAADDKHVDGRSTDGSAYSSAVFRARSGAAASLAQLLPDLAVVTVADLGPALVSGPLLRRSERSGARGRLHDGLVTAGVPEVDARRFVHGVQRGGAIVVVVAALRNVERLVDVLSSCAPSELDRRRSTAQSH